MVKYLFSFYGLTFSVNSLIPKKIPPICGSRWFPGNSWPIPSPRSPAADLEQQQQPCASSRPRSGRVKQQQQSILLAAVPCAARHGCWIFWNPHVVFLETHNCACTFWGNWWWGGRDGRDYVHIYDKLNRGPIVVNHCKPTWLIMGNHRIEQCDSSAQKQRREENKDWDLTGYLGLSWNVLWGFKQKFHGDILWGCIADDCSWDS